MGPSGLGIKLITAATGRRTRGGGGLSGRDETAVVFLGDRGLQRWEAALFLRFPGNATSLSACLWVAQGRRGARARFSGLGASLDSSESRPGAAGLLQAPGTELHRQRLGVRSRYDATQGS